MQIRESQRENILSWLFFFQFSDIFYFILSLHMINVFRGKRHTTEKQKIRSMRKIEPLQTLSTIQSVIEIRTNIQITDHGLAGITSQ